MKKSLADQLRRAVKESGITVYELSRRSEVHRSQLSRFLRGQRDLGLTMADKLCRVLGLTLAPDGARRPARAVPEEELRGVAKKKTD